MKQTRSIDLRLRHFVLGLGLMLLLGLATGGAVLALALPRADAPNGPSGIINYAGLSGEYSVLPDGRAADHKGVAPPLVVQSLIPLEGPWPAPAGTASAYLESSEGETWMVIANADGAYRITQIAGSGDPPLVAGAKGEAQSANGVPLVASWSPDGALLAFGSVNGFPYTLNVASIGSASPLRFEVGGDYVGEAVWSHDGRYLAVSSYTIDRSHHTVFIWDRETGGLRQLIDGCHIVWSPDSSYLVIHRDPYEQPGVSVVSIDGEHVRSLSDDPYAFPSAWVAE